MKGKKIALISSIVLSYLLIIAGIVLYAVFATQRCTYTVDGSSSSCPSSVTDDFPCTHIFSLKYDEEFSVSFYCPWYPRDVGLGEAALGLSFIFVTMVALKKQLKLKSQKVQIRIALGFISAIALFAAVILSFVDLFDAALGSTGIDGLNADRDVYKANGAMVILSFIMVLGLTIWDLNKYLKKSRKVANKVKKVDHQVVQLPA